MYQIIEIASREIKGYFATCVQAQAWAEAHGGLALFLIMRL